MSKKNTNIEVKVEEKEIDYQNKKEMGTVVSIAKKEIGWIIPKGSNFEVVQNNQTNVSVKTVDEGIEILIRNWNLQQ